MFPFFFRPPPQEAFVIGAMGDEKFDKLVNGIVVTSIFLPPCPLYTNTHTHTHTQTDGLGGHEVQVAEPVRRQRSDGALRRPRGEGIRRQDAGASGSASAVQHARGSAPRPLPSGREPGTGVVHRTVLIVQGALHGCVTQDYHGHYYYGDMPWSFKGIKGSREACIGPRGSHSRPSYAGSITGFVCFLATFTANDVDLT